MSQNRDVILKLRGLIELRENTIIANKKAMKAHLIEYKKSLELDKELKKEMKSLKEAINLLQYGPSSNEEVFILTQNNASNRDEDIYTNDEE